MRVKSPNDVIEGVNSGLNERQRIECAMPAYMMIPWAKKIGVSNPTHRDAMACALYRLDQDIERCTAGLTRKAAAALRERAERDISDAMVDLLDGPRNSRPSTLTGFATCGFAWQMLCEQGKITLEPDSWFDLTWNALGYAVVISYDYETLAKVRKSALKRAEVLIGKLNAKGYYL